MMSEKVENLVSDNSDCSISVTELDDNSGDEGLAKIVTKPDIEPKDIEIETDIEKNKSDKESSSKIKRRVNKPKYNCEICGKGNFNYTEVMRHYMRKTPCKYVEHYFHKRDHGITNATLFVLDHLSNSISLSKDNNFIDKNIIKFQKLVKRLQEVNLYNGSKFPHENEFNEHVNQYYDRIERKHPHLFEDQ